MASSPLSSLLTANLYGMSASKCSFCFESQRLFLSSQRFFSTFVRPPTYHSGSVSTPFQESNQKPSRTNRLTNSSVPRSRRKYSKFSCSRSFSSIAQVKSTCLEECAPKPDEKRELNQDQTPQDNNMPEELPDDPSYYRPSKRLGALLNAFNIRHSLPVTYNQYNEPHDPQYLIVTIPQHSYSFQSVLIKYIYHLYNEPPGSARIENALGKLSQIDICEVTSRGYSLDDLDLWADIATSKDPFKPFTHLHQLIELHTKSPPQHNPIPLFPLHFFLLRARVSNSTVMLLSRYFKARLDYELQVYLSSSRPSFLARQGLLHSGVTFLIFSRLLRLACQTCPGAIKIIASILTSYLETFSQIIISSKKDSVQLTRALSRITIQCNSALSQLSTPVKSEPFRTANIRSAAQFSILRCMAQFSPPISITISGYKGIIAVQLQRPKTENEKDWVAMQSRSWPPWKEERTGLDADKDVEYGLSRTVRVVNSMLGAGYAPKNWTELAVMYGGWDTDDTPLTQTRRIVSFVPEEPSETHAVRRWIARIDCTRTLREAWAMFEHFRDSEACNNIHHLSPVLSDVYKAVFRRIIVSGRPQLPLRGPTDLPLPGDGLEVFSDSIYDHDHVEVNSEPPTVEGLIEEMLYSGIQPQASLVAFLIRNASCPTQMIWLLTTLLPEFRWDVFYTGNDAALAEMLGVNLRPFIIFLCHWKLLPTERACFSGPMFSTLLPSWRVLRHHPSIHAIHLAEYLPSIDDELLTFLTRSLSFRSSGDIFYVPQGIPTEFQTLVLFRLLRTLVETHSAHLGFLSGQVLVNLNFAAARAAEASQIVNEWLSTISPATILDSSIFSNTVAEIRQQVDWLKESAGEYLFHKLCNYIGLSIPSSPRQDGQILNLGFSPATRALLDPHLQSDHLTSIPPVALLHSLTRTLGILGDLPRLTVLVEFISNHEDLWEGKKMRKVVVAVAYFSGTPSPLSPSPSSFQSMPINEGTSSKELTCLKDEGLEPDIEEVTSEKAEDERIDFFHSYHHHQYQQQHYQGGVKKSKEEIYKDGLRQRIRKAVEGISAPWGGIWPTESEIEAYESFQHPEAQAQATD